MITVDDLTVKYGDMTAVQSANFTLRSPGIHGIIGPNGSGKSTLMKAMVGLLPAADGKKNGKHISLDGSSPDTVRKSIAYIAQRSEIDGDFPADVFDVVLMGTYPSLGPLRRPGAKHRAEAKQALESVNMWEFRHRHISELSGGQFQRVLFARAIIQKADYLFLDEPFAGIDISSEQTIMCLLKAMAAEGKHIFIVHHDMNTVTEYFDDLVIMNRHLVASGPTSEVFTSDNLRASFGGLFLESSSLEPHGRQGANA